VPATPANTATPRRAIKNHQAKSLDQLTLRGIEASVHFDTGTEVQARRQAVLDRAHAQYPERFTHRPQPPRLPEQAWINQPVLQPVGFQKSA
jgi:hypothetical protein